MSRDFGAKFLRKRRVGFDCDEPASARQSFSQMARHFPMARANFQPSFVGGAR